jgi:L-fuculose-phosphate aldolase
VTPAGTAAVSGRPPTSAAEAREQVAAACRILGYLGHEDLTLGHVSVRGPDPLDIFIKRKGKGLAEVTAEDVLTVRLDDPHGYRSPGAHLETVMHMEAYRLRPEVGAAIHTHPLYATALGATKAELAFLSHDAVLFHDGVPGHHESAGLVTTPEQGRSVATTLGGRRAVLLHNHGIFVVGEDVRWAVLAAVTLERAAKLQMVASAIGELAPLEQSAADAVFPNKYRADFLDEYWDSWCRLDRTSGSRHRAGSRRRHSGGSGEVAEDWEGKP